MNPYATRPYTSIAALFLLVGCHGGSSPSTPDSSETIATIGEKKITATAFKAKLAEQPPVLRSRYKTLDKKKELVDNLVRFEVLLEEAHRRNLDTDPEAKAMLDKFLVGRLVRLKQEEAEKASAPSEAEAKKHYDEHIAEFVRPARMRVGHVFLASPKSDPKHAKAGQEAARILAELKTKDAGSSHTAFASLASSRSDDTSTKEMGGDLGFKTREELSQAWGDAVASAAAALKTTGDLSGVIESDKGFHVLKLLQRQEGIEQSFESVKSRIEGQLAMKRRAQALDEFVAQLKSKANVTIDEKALDRISVESMTPAPPTPAPHPQP